MAARFTPVLFAILAVSGGPTVAAGPAADALTVIAQTPTVTVSKRIPGRQLLELPTLELAFEIEARCRGQATPQSLSMDVADSRRSISAEELGETGKRELVMTVPASQIAPIPVNNFCVVETVGDAAAAVPGASASNAPPRWSPERITVEDALSAHISLLCANATSGEERISYVTKPLAVTFVCEHPAGGADSVSPGAGER